MNEVLQSLLVTFCAGLISINGDISRKGHCPTLPREYRNDLNCTTNSDECSRDSECPETDKCCFNGCGFFCAAADNIPVEKNGDCPRLQPIYSGPCKDTCLLDDDCPDIQKCCSNGCGLNCMKPGGLLTISKHPTKNISGPSGLIDKKGNASVEINLAVVLPSQRSENEGTIYKSGSLKNLKEESIKETLSNDGGNNTKYYSIPNNQSFPEGLQVQSSERSRDNFPSQVMLGNSQPDTAPISIQSNPQSVFGTKFEHAQPQELNGIISSSESTIKKTSTELPLVTKTSTEVPPVTKTSTEIPSVTTTGNSTRINHFLYRVPLRKIKRRKNINNSNQVLNHTESLNITGTLTEKSDNISVSPSLFSNSTLQNEFTVSPDIFPGTDDDVHTKFESSNFTDFYNEEWNTSSHHHNSQQNLTESVDDEVIDKPGHCPTDQLGNTAVCTEQCSTDRNCTGALKCCSNGCGHECVEPLAFFNKPGECPVLEPGKIGVCIHLCSSDSNCTGMLKCCSNGCGHQCIEPQEIINKPGFCPKRNETDNPNKKKYCLHLCDNDSHCSENLKCCEEGCSTKCLLPEFHIIKKPGLCPPVQPGVLGACVEMCSNDSDCYNVQKCCSNGCGHVCRKPIEVRENPGMCPISQKNMNTACFDQCFSDEDCGQVKKCCYNGCAKECQSANIIKKVELKASERDIAIASGNEVNKIPSERETLEKPGFCFPIKHTNKSKDCAALCTNDGHCNGSKKCCPSGCGFECQESSAVPLKEGECPLVPKEYVGSCFNYCRTDEDCVGNQKCCSNGCGKLCLSPNKKFKKEGQCPNDINIKKEYSPCFNLCRSDDDCMGSKLCCTQGCSRICTKPDVPAFRLGECPMIMPGESGTCAEECVVDKDCGEFLKCCLNECGSHSCRKPTAG